MRHAVILLCGPLAIAAALAAACGTHGDVTDGDPGAGADGSTTLTPAGGGEPTGPAGSGLNTGLPCDVQAILENRCIACHDGKTQVAMLTYDDLMKKSSVDPTKTLAQESAIRMQSTSSPMPPPPAVPPEPDEIQTFVDWVAAGTPKGALCTDPPPDGGSGADGGADAAVDAAPVCTSGQTYKGGNNTSMRPGEACNACHQKQGGPNLRIAGTVYPTAHEPDDCNGSKPPPTLTVTITDKNNKTVNLTVNSVGNFSTGTRVTAPFKATVTGGGRTRSMVGSVTSGDCNSCHTVAGLNGAPGRIMAP